MKINLLYYIIACFIVLNSCKNKELEQEKRLNKEFELELLNFIKKQFDENDKSILYLIDAVQINGNRPRDNKILATSIKLKNYRDSIIKNFDNEYFIANIDTNKVNTYFKKLYYFKDSLILKNDIESQSLIQSLNTDNVSIITKLSQIALFEKHVFFRLRFQVGKDYSDYRIYYLNYENDTIKRNNKNKLVITYKFIQKSDFKIHVSNLKVYNNNILINNNIEKIGNSYIIEFTPIETGIISIKGEGIYDSQFWGKVSFKIDEKIIVID
jgi:hypothetical protein